MKWDGPVDVRNGIYAALNLSGSSWTTLKDLDSALSRLRIPRNGMDDLIRDGKIVFYDDVSLGPLFTVPRVYEKERHLARNMIRVKSAPSHRRYPDDFKIQKMIEDFGNETGKHLCDEQQDAVIKALKNLVLILTGGPGTGKTCTLNTIDHCLRLCGYKDILYAAPTGKAARRVTESTGKEACTLHKMIKITKENMRPSSLKGEVIIVDEVSMLDLDVADALFEAVPSGMKVILVGDTDQLPSVGKGAVLRDVIGSGVIPVARLIKTFRQGNESLIFTNMKKIRDGNPDLEVGEDFAIAMPNKRYSAVDEILAIYMSEYERLGGNDELCLLTPFRRRKFASSSEALNAKLQGMINPSGLSLPGACEEVFRKGDPVMQTQNRKECANGDVGRVIDTSQSGLVVRFTDGAVTYSKKELLEGQLTLSYAMSIHKSQGSEYKSVITTILNEHSVMLQRNLLYTAVTRAKKNCFLVCEEDAVKKAVSTVADKGRLTKLSEWLRREDFMEKTSIERKNAAMAAERK